MTPCLAPLAHPARRRALDDRAVLRHGRRRHLRHVPASRCARACSTARLAHAGAFSIVALVVHACGLSQVRQRPVRRQSAARAAVRAFTTGANSSVDGTYPTEVQPLVDDLNALLDHREQMVRARAGKGRRSRARLEDPTRRADAGSRARRRRRASGPRGGGRPAGGADAAAGRLSPRARPRRGVGRHAGRAVLGARIGRGARTHACSGCTRIAESPFTSTSCPPSTRCASSARTWTKCWATSSTTRASGRARASPSVRPNRARPLSSSSMTMARAWRRRCARSVLQRGVRADEAAPGSGFGLAIVRELAELYGGSIVLDASPLGGVRARLQLPT